MRRWYRNLIASFLISILFTASGLAPVTVNAADANSIGHQDKYTILQGRAIDKFLEDLPASVRNRISQQFNEALARVSGDTSKVALAVWATQDFKEYVKGLERTDPKAAREVASDSVEYGPQTVQVVYEIYCTICETIVWASRNAELLGWWYNVGSLAIEYVAKYIHDGHIGDTRGGVKYEVCPICQSAPEMYLPGSECSLLVCHPCGDYEFWSYNTY